MTIDLSFFVLLQVSYGLFDPDEPVILQLTDSLSVPVNGVAELSCVVDSNPSPTIAWLLNGSPVTGATGSLYRVDPVTASTAGEYSCVATNIVGTASGSLTLTALCK